MLETTHSSEPKQVEKYTTRAVPLSPDFGRILTDWKALNVRYRNDLLDCDPEWLLEEYKGEESKVRVFLLEKDGELVGAVPFEKSAKPHFFKLGELRAVQLPFKSFRLLGYSLSMPADTMAYDALFGEIAKTAGDFDGLYMGHVELESFLWNYLHTSPLIRRHFRRYSPIGPQPHPLTRFHGTFDDYMGKFSARSRANRRREIKKLREGFRVELARFVKVEEVDGFIDEVLKISGNTWQFQLHGRGWGLRAADPSVWKRRLQFAAERGWFRSYILKCDGVGCAFVLGLQHSGRFYHMFVGFDQTWSEHRVGTVLQLLVLEDLFKENPPQLYDFGTYFQYKEYFSTESYSEARIALLPRRAYPLLVETLDRSWHASVHQAAALFDRLHIKPAVRSLVRRLGHH